MDVVWNGKIDAPTSRKLRQNIYIQQPKLIKFCSRQQDDVVVSHIIYFFLFSFHKIF